MNIFLIRPTTRNIGNDLIGFAASKLILEVFGVDANVVNIPALKGPQFGGLVARQVYDINRLADAVVVGCGNLLENGQLSYEAQAVDALRPPMMLMGLSHGRIAGRDGTWESRTDALAPAAIRHLVRKSGSALVRDEASRDILLPMGAEVAVGGCPTLFLRPAAHAATVRSGVVISIRHPSRMCVPPALQWRVADDLRQIIAALQLEYGEPVRLACHDYIDLEFAAAFPEARPLYFDDVQQYLTMLQGCRLHVSYRLHGFLPCLALGSHSIHMSYDERGRSMVSTIGMESWDIDLLSERDCVDAVMDRARSVARFDTERSAVWPRIEALREVSLAHLRKLRDAIPVRDTYNRALA